MKVTSISAGGQWAMKDPFLFCAYHVDEYPRGNGQLAPAERGGGKWSMYHGTTIPGFPYHPHVGFETITLVLSGVIDHGDSAGSYGRYGAGDVQWMTAGRGILHSEMMPLVNTDGPNPLVLFQIWLNLPAARKGAKPSYIMQWAERVPVATPSAGVSVYVHAGAYTQPDGVVVPPAACPPESYAADADADVAVWRVRVERDATVALPPTRSAAAVRRLFVYHGSVIVTLGGQTVVAAAPAAVQLPVGGAAAVVTAGAATAPRDAMGVILSDGGAAAAFLVLQGVPLNEPVVSHGPYIATTRSGIAAAQAAYARGDFGRWPFDTKGPTFGGADVGRFQYNGGARQLPPAGGADVAA